MAIDTNTLEGKAREQRNASLLIAKRKHDATQSEISYLIHATPTSERRNALCDINILLSQARIILDTLSSEES